MKSQRAKSALVPPVRVERTLHEVERDFELDDLARLRKLFLIEDAKDGPRLTLTGRIHFASLPKGVFVGAPRHADYQSVPEALPKPSNKRR